MSRTTAIVAGMFVALVLVAMGFAQAPSPAPAFKGRLATKAPLLAVAPAGPRLVAVGDYGVILLSDDAGATWRQAAAVATRNMLTAVAFADAKRGWAVGQAAYLARDTFHKLRKFKNSFATSSFAKPDQERPE